MATTTTVVDGGLVNATAPVAAAAPMINLDLKDKLIVKTGSVIILDIPFSGRPTPDIVWTKDDVEIYSGDRVTIENAATSTTLSIKNCQRSDAGNYRLALANTAGRAKADVDVVVIDKPGPPKEVRVDDIMQDSAALSWRQPMDEGGSNITNYAVEKFDYERNNWVMVNPYVPGFNYTVPNLVPGAEYIFRVAAENQCGLGEPTESERIVVQNRHGRPPGVPGTLTYEEVTGDRVTLRWSPPLDDGGSEVTNYVIQKRDSNDPHGWSTVTSSATRTSHRVGNLNPGGHYRFRVRAENYYGPGPWTESGSVMLGGSSLGRGQVQQSMSSFSSGQFATLPAGMSFQQPAYIIAQAPMQSNTLPYGAMPGWGSMTMQQEPAPQPVAPKPDPIGPILRQGVTLVGKDFTEVLLMLMQGNTGMPDPLARFYAYQPMDQMGEQQLNDSTGSLCGFKPAELLILCGLTPNRSNTLKLCHYLIILANEDRSHHPSFNSLEDVLGTVKLICKKQDLSYDAISLINALIMLVDLGRKYRHQDLQKFEKALHEARTNVTNRELGRIILTILGLNVVVVKVNVTLKNKDITPLLLSLKDGDVDLPPNGDDLCRFKLDTPLDQMTDDELRENIEELSGFTPENLLELIQMPPTRQNVLALAHLMIQRANEDLPVTPAALTPKARSRTSSQSSGTGQEVGMKRSLTGPERAARVGRKLDWLETALEEAAVKQALNCARLSASKPAKELDRDSLLRSLENLEDVTKQYQHPEWRYYQETLTIARQSVSDPNLGKLVLALIGKPS
ncbi:IGSF22 [Branchiostoma lanceolatum]|uniref:IGSF22 protein n=1 Tax=Branchiostoma lanceolatum TaxID=7740 RepID=A0A8J9VEY3_BRALA|nr:IGSF22 [Branchiostoma lanceolatum]